MVTAYCVRSWVHIEYKLFQFSVWWFIYCDIRFFLPQLLSFDKNCEYHENFQWPTSRVRTWPGKRSGKGVALIMRTRPQENLSPTQGTPLYYSRGRRNARPIALIIKARQRVEQLIFLTISSRIDSHYIWLIFPTTNLRHHTFPVVLFQP